jgi:hypothetical protein
VIATILALAIGAVIGAGVMALAAAAGHATLREEAEAQAAIAYARGLRKGREES